MPEHASPASIADGRWGRGHLLVLAAVLVLGLIQLPTPFDADQTTFALGAREMSDGGFLYRDFWDSKPPGIFCFYWVAGRLFGFDEFGIHAFELLYWLAFSVVLMRCVWTAYRDRLAALLAPLLTAGVYYSIAGDWHLTQVEALVGVPIFLVLWFASRPARSPGSAGVRSFLSGVIGGVALLFKPQFLPIVAGFWVLAAVLGPGTRATTRVRRALASLLPSLGILVAVAPVVAVYAAARELHTLWWTVWEYPLYLNAQWGGWRYGPLVEGIGWFVYRCAPLMALAALGVAADLRGERRLLTANLVLWVVLGFAVIMVQRVSWWPYHYLLLLVPLGLLAARGASVLWRALRPMELGPGGRWSMVLKATCIALLFAGIIGSALARAGLLAHDRFALRAEDRARYQMRVGKAYEAAMPEVGFLRRPASLPGPIFVLGGPEYYYLSGRAQAGHPRGNRFFRFLTPVDWDRLTAGLGAKPPTYVFVQHDHLDIVLRPARATASFRRFLSDQYRERGSSEAGVWYVRREAEAESVRFGGTDSRASE